MGKTEELKIEVCRAECSNVDRQNINVCTLIIKLQNVLLNQLAMFKAHRSSSSQSGVIIEV